MKLTPQVNLIILTSGFHLFNIKCFFFFISVKYILSKININSPAGMAQWSGVDL